MDRPARARGGVGGALRRPRRRPWLRPLVRDRTAADRPRRSSSARPPSSSSRSPRLRGADCSGIAQLRRDRRRLRLAAVLADLRARLQHPGVEHGHSAAVLSVMSGNARCPRCSNWSAAGGCGDSGWTSGHSRTRAGRRPRRDLGTDRDPADRGRRRGRLCAARHVPRAAAALARRQRDQPLDPARIVLPEFFVVGSVNSPLLLVGAAAVGLATVVLVSCWNGRGSSRRTRRSNRLPGALLDRRDPDLPLRGRRPPRHRRGAPRQARLRSVRPDRVLGLGLGPDHRRDGRHPRAERRRDHRLLEGVEAVDVRPGLAIALSFAPAAVSTR